MIGRWRTLGPTRISAGLGATGRIMCLAIDPNAGSTMYAGALSGAGGGGCGLWKTTNGGGNWSPIADHLPSLLVLDVAIDPTVTQRVYMAIRHFQNQGSGLYRSNDGGTTWTLISSDARLDGRTLLINHSVSSVMYMAAPAAVYRSSDGGASWQPVLQDSVGQITDLVMDRSDPSVLYAGMRTPSVSTVAGIYRTDDGGDNWTRLTGCPGKALPAPAANTTIRLALSGDRIYAGFKASSSFGLYRTTGTTCTVGGRLEPGWEKRWQAGSAVADTIWSFIYADPVNPSFVYVTGTSFRVSTDGGKSFNVASGPHVDHHAFATDPNNAAIIYTGCDGGIYKSTNRGAAGTWSFVGNGLDNVEFYDIADAATDPELVIGGTQDNGTIKYAGAADAWAQIRGGDGATVDIDHTDHRTLYSMNQYASSIGRSKDGGAFQNIAKGLPIGSTCFNLPFHVHPRTTSTLLASCGDLWRTTTSEPPGDWVRIFKPAVGGVTRSAVDPITDVYYAGTSLGEVFAGLGGVGFKKVFALADVVAGSESAVTDIQMDPDSTTDMYVSFRATKAGRILRVQRGGAANPRDITANLPEGVLVQTIAVDRMRRFSLFVGTSHRGVYYGTSTDDGATWGWQAYNDGLPAAVDVRRLLTHPTTGVLRAGTSGRGAYEVDTDSPLGSVLAAEGRVRILRVHDLGTGFGPTSDFLDVEVVVRLDTDPDKAYGFQLREDVHQQSRRKMLDVLRDAYNRNGQVRIEYTRTGLRTGLAFRVIAI